VDRRPLPRPLRAVVGLTAGRRYAIGAVCMLVALLGWALASPVGASPDENYHLGSIWCGQGIRTGVCEPGESAASRRLPSQLPSAVRCYAFEPTQTPTCQPDLSHPGELTDTEAVNASGLYPPVFYWVASFFVGDDITVTVMAIRVFNAFFYIGIVTAVYLLVGARLRRPLVLGALITAVPLGLFLIPSVNPSSWAILSATTFFVSLVGHLTADERRRRIALGVLAGVCLVIGAGARADAAIYGVVAVVAAVVLTWRREGAVRRLVYPGLLALAAAVTFLLPAQTNAANPGGQTFSASRFVAILADVPALWIGGAGSPPPQRDFLPHQAWGLGWLDTAMPGVVWVGVWGVFAAVLFAAVTTEVTRRRMLAVGVTGAAALLIPAYVQYLGQTSVGRYVQPRYVLPLLILLGITALVRLDGPPLRVTRGQRWIIVGVLTIANAAAVYMNVRRYVTGVDSKNWNLDSAAEWWWNLPVTPMTLCALVTIAFGAGAVLLTSGLSDEARPTAPARAG
jgi:hypothetical protein